MTIEKSILQLDMASVYYLRGVFIMLSSINVNIRSSATIFKSKVVYEQSKVPLTDFEKSYIDR